MASYDLNGKVVLVTGGARGIGFATAKALIARGATVAVLDLDEAGAVSAAAQLHDSRAYGIGANVTDRAAMQRAVASIVERSGGLDVVIANAGIAPRLASFRAMASESFERVLDVNLWGVYRTVDAALPEIIRRRGHVVVTSSVYAFLNGIGATPYAMSKAGVEQFGRALRVELSIHGASASVAYFGFIDTEMVHRSIDSDPLADRMFQTLPRPLRKRLSPAVAGEAVVRGIEKRAPRIIQPPRWAVMSVLRGVLNPFFDNYLERDASTLAALREFDQRSGEDQPTTA